MLKYNENRELKKTHRDNDDTRCVCWTQIRHVYVSSFLKSANDIQSYTILRLFRIWLYMCMCSSQCASGNTLLQFVNESNDSASIDIEIQHRYIYE